MDFVRMYIRPSRCGESSGAQEGVRLTQPQGLPPSWGNLDSVGGKLVSLALSCGSVLFKTQDR